MGLVIAPLLRERLGDAGDRPDRSHIDTAKALAYLETERGKVVISV